MIITSASFYQKIGNKIMETRLDRRLTREYLSELADISAKFLYEIEMGTKGCSSYVLYRLANALEISIDNLLFDNSKLEAENAGILLNCFNDKDKRTIKSFIKILYEITNTNV